MRLDASQLMLKAKIVSMKKAWCNLETKEVMI
jgi:hypothetical protein